jgi:hypothetical protein
MRKALTLLIALLCANLALAQNKPLACQADEKAGLKWANGVWKQTRFELPKFILVLSGNTLTRDSVARVFGHEYPNMVRCETGYDGRIFCSGGTGASIAFNPKNLQGGYSTIFGATDDKDERDTLSLAPFTCQPY